MKVRGAVFEGVGKPLVVENLEMHAEPGPGEVLVRYAASGLCHSDLRRLHDPEQQPEVLGHEGAGTVEAVGEGVRDLAPGDRFVASFRPYCGLCWHCLRGEGVHCEWGGGFVARSKGAPRFIRPDGTALSARLGTFAEAAVLPREFIVKVETDLPFEQLALIGCGVTTGVGAVTNTAGVVPGSSVAVIGCGGVGQAAIQGAVIAGASRIIAVDTLQDKLAIALSQGATHAIQVQPGLKLEDAVRDLTKNGRGVDYVIEVTGFGNNVTSALRMVRKRGVVVAVGLRPDTIDLSVRDLIMNECQLRGSLYGSAQTPVDFPKLIDLAEHNRLNLQAMVSSVISLDQIAEGFEAMERGAVVRSVISY